MDYLYKREMVTEVYVPALMPVRLDDNRRIKALLFVADRMHQQYAGGLNAEKATAAVRDARGRNGFNSDYVANTVAHLDELGITDSLLHRVDVLLKTKTN